MQHWVLHWLGELHTLPTRQSPRETPLRLQGPPYSFFSCRAVAALSALADCKSRLACPNASVRAVVAAAVALRPSCSRSPRLENSRALSKSLIGVGSFLCCAFARSVSMMPSIYCRLCSGLNLKYPLAVVHGKLPTFHFPAPPLPAIVVHCGETIFTKRNSGSTDTQAVGKWAYRNSCLRFTNGPLCDTANPESSCSLLAPWRLPKQPGCHYPPSQQRASILDSWLLPS